MLQKCLRGKARLQNTMLIVTSVVLSAVGQVLFIAPNFTDPFITTLLYATTTLSMISCVYAVGYLKTVVFPHNIVESDELTAAIMEGRIDVVFQPVYRLSNGTITGFESLVRLNHPKYGYIQPDHLLPSIAAADPTVARHLTAYVVDRTASYHQTLSAAGYDLQMSINLCHHDLATPAIISTFAKAAFNYNVPLSSFTVEVSNDIVSVDPKTSLQVIAGIESAEIKLSLDDFTSGGSPFLHIRDFLVDEVKIANVVTHGITANSHNAETVRAIVHTAHSTGTYVTAKCIETPSELAHIKELGCDFVQGYIIAPPMTPDQARVWLKTQKVQMVH